MSFKKLFTPVVLALHLYTLEVTAQSCEAYCNNFNKITTSCVGQDPNITGSGPIALNDVDCMCTVSNTENVARCYECNFLTGASLELLDAWVIVCYTKLVSGTVAAENCFNQELIKGSIGAPCASASSTTMSTSTSTTMSAKTTSATTTPATSTAVSTTIPTLSPTPIGAIVGGSVGGVAAIALAAVLVFFIIRRIKNQKSNPQFSYSTTAPMQPTLQGPPPQAQQFYYPPTSQYPFPNASSPQGPTELYTATYPEKQTLSEKTHQVYDLPQPSNDKSMANSSDNIGSGLVPPYTPPVNYETEFPQQNSAMAPRQNAFELSNMSPYNTPQP